MTVTIGNTNDYKLELKALQADPEGSSPLTEYAFELLIADLERKDNKLSPRHQLALYELLTGMTGFACGSRKGRYVYPLATGGGKTSAIVAWITALYKLEMSDISVSVSACTVSALCALKGQLIEQGVPEELIGIKFANEQSMPFPSTGNHDRRFQLVTHARVRGGFDNDLFLRHQGKERALMIYDESLIKSDARAIQKGELMAEIKGLPELVKGTLREAEFGPLLMYLENAGKQIEAALEAIKCNGAEIVSIITLPARTPEQLKTYLDLMKRYPRNENIRELLEISQHALRVVSTGQHAGVVCYELGIPDELKNILVLDASYPIRRLCQIDSSVSQGGQFGGEIKRFDNVVMHCMKSPSGRGALQDSFSVTRREGRQVSREVIEIIKNADSNEAILIFTFKPKAGYVDISKTLMDDMRAAGVDVDAVLTSHKRRINILTWGQETSLNGYSHCGVVILAGVLHQPLLAIASKIIGQRDNLKAEAGSRQISEVQHSEQAHMIYQAVSRGRCRTVTNGQANPMQIFMIHNSPQRIRPLLDQVMPGLQWKPWSAQFNEQKNQTKQNFLVSKMQNFLRALPHEVTKVFTRDIRTVVLGEAIDTTASRLFSRAIRQLLNDCYGEWYKDGHSLMRMPSVFAE